MSPVTAGILAVIGYLAGSLSAARFVARFAGVELGPTTMVIPGGATVDYGGVSATAIGARAGPRWGIVTGIADMAKAFIPTLAVRLAWPDEHYHLVVAVAVVVGHNYPIFFRFRGGRGQSPLYGGLLAVDWLALPVTTVVGIPIGLFVIRDMVVAYVLGQVLLIPWFAWRAGLPEVAYAAAVNALFLVAAIPEFRGYLRARRSGEARQVTTWRSFTTSHPALGSERFDEDHRAPD